MADNNEQQLDPEDDNGVMVDDEGYGDPAEELDPAGRVPPRQPDPQEDPLEGLSRLTRQMDERFAQVESEDWERTGQWGVRWKET